MVERDNLNSVTSSNLTSGSNATGIAIERSAEEIRQNIAATRESITETVDELSSMVQRTFDWKAYVQDYPLAATGAVAGAGLLLGYMLRRRATPGERIHNALADMAEDVIDRFQYQFNDIGLRRPGFSHTLKAAAIARIVQAAGNYARDKFIASNQMESQEMAETNNAEPAEARHARSY